MNILNDWPAYLPGLLAGLGISVQVALLSLLVGTAHAVGVSESREQGNAQVESKTVCILAGATVAKAPPGCAIVRVGEASDSAFFVLGGRAVAGVPGEGDEVRSLATIGPGDFFGEIAAITGSPRTANVVSEGFTEVMEIPAATLRELRGVPEMDHLISLKLSERLTRTANADLIRLAGLDQRDLRVDRRMAQALLPGDELHQLVGALDIGRAVLQRARGRGRTHQALRRRGIFLERHEVLRLRRAALPR